MSDAPYADTWTDAENERLAELRAEKPRPVKAEVAYQRQLARRPLAERTPPAWAERAMVDREQEAELLRAYQATSPDVRAWLDEHTEARLRGRRLRDLWRDYTRVGVLLDWRAGRLEVDGLPVAAEPQDHDDQAEGERVA